MIGGAGKVVAHRRRSGLNKVFNITRNLSYECNFSRQLLRDHFDSIIMSNFPNNVLRSPRKVREHSNMNASSSWRLPGTGCLQFSPCDMALSMPLGWHKESELLSIFQYDSNKCKLYNKVFAQTHKRLNKHSSH